MTHLLIGLFCLTTVLPACGAVKPELQVFTEAIPLKPTSIDTAVAGFVAYVVAGDIVAIQVKNGVQNIRLQGVVAPNINQPYGRRAKQYLQWACERKIVSIDVIGHGIDKLPAARIYQGGRDLSLMLIALGLAYWDQRAAPNDDGLRNAEASAKQLGIGLWSQSQRIPSRLRR